MVEVNVKSGKCIAINKGIANITYLEPPKPTAEIHVTYVSYIEALGSLP